MSTKELSRVEVMGRLHEKRMTQKEAARILGISERQVKRLWKRYREKGACGLGIQAARETEQQSYDGRDSASCGRLAA